MIDKKVFHREWVPLAARFGKEENVGQEAAYWAFLNPLMGDEEFTAAARTIWATAKWFPRPADFLLVNAAAEWAGVMECMERSGRLHAWHEQYAALPERARKACMALGGVPILKTLHDKDPIRAKTEWERALEQATAGEVLQIEAAAARPALESRNTSTRALQPVRADVPPAGRRLHAVPKDAA